MALTLQEFTYALDPKTLPRIIQIQSGIYFQGSVYEMFGNECCLPTGEVIKIIGLNISKLSAEIQNDGPGSMCIELPLDYPGLFRIVADNEAYVSIGDIVKSLHIPNRLSQPVFKSTVNITLSNGNIQQGETIMFTSLGERNSEQFVNTEVMRNDKKHNFTLPLSLQGEFYECEDDQFYTLKEIIEWKLPKDRKRAVNLAKTSAIKEFTFCDLPENFKGELILTPVYELQAVMKFRKDIVHIPSSLDVEVIDVTDMYDINSFVQPLSINDIFNRPSSNFPIVAEIIEGPDQTVESLKFLKSCKEIIIHQAFQAKRILASEIRSDAQKHFLIPCTYNGKFKRRPREFPTAYDLEIAKSDKEQLHVVATKAFESHYEGLSTVSVGDQFLVQHRKTSEVIYGGTRKTVEALTCEKIEGKGHEPVLIPMCMEGGFVEVIHDKKQYHISEICQKFLLPFNVKVAVRDLSIGEDILATMLGLHLEEEITEPCLLITPLKNLSECWEIPVNRIKMSLQLLHRPDKGTEPPPAKTVVEEISEDCYYTLRRYVNATLHPPPRPPKKPLQPPSNPFKLESSQPKRPDASSSPKSPHVNTLKPFKPIKVISPELQNAMAECEFEKITSTESNLQKASPEQLTKEKEDDDDDDGHDYEYIEKDEVEDMRKKFQEEYIENKTNC